MRPHILHGSLPGVGSAIYPAQGFPCVFKDEVRVLGFDDSPHTRNDLRVSVVGVAMRGGRSVEAILRTDVGRDGDDATERLAACVNGYAGKQGTVAVLLQNVMVAGFNTIDLDALHEAVSLPVIAVARGKPDLAAVRHALVEGRIPNGAVKWCRIEAVAKRMRPSADGKLTITAVGMDPLRAQELVQVCTARGFMPEPLRLAHLIGAGWVLGQSKGS